MSKAFWTHSSPVALVRARRPRSQGRRLTEHAQIRRTPEKRTMLAETLREWDEQKVNEGRLAGREEERMRLRGVAGWDFDAATANTLARLAACPRPR